MNEEFRSKLSKEIYMLVRNVAEKRGVDIDTRILEFLENLLLESYDYRRDEWWEKLAVEDDERILQVAAVTAERLLMEAKAYNTPGTQRGTSLLLIGIIDQIRKRWCSWPLCS